MFLFSVIVGLRILPLYKSCTASPEIFPIVSKCCKLQPERHSCELKGNRGAVEDHLTSNLRIVIVLLPRCSFAVYPCSGEGRFFDEGTFPFLFLNWRKYVIR